MAEMNFSFNLNSSITSPRYPLIEAPSARTLALRHGLKLKPKVDISESERIPG